MPEFETKVQELNQLGENLLKAGNADAAYEYFQQAEQADPNCITSYLNQAKVLISTDALKEAQEALNKALLLDAQNAEALFHMANVCFLSDLYEQGLLYAGQALEAGCNEVMLYQNMALAHEKLGHLDNALRFYSKAINLNPLDGSTYVAKAECQMRNHRDDDALQTLSMLHQNCPDSFEAYHYSYIIYARKREYDKAQKVLSKGIEDFPGEVEFYIDMIHLLNINRQPKEALELLDALDEVKDSVNLDERDIKLERAKAYLCSERLPESKKLLQKVITLPGAPDFEAHYLLANCCLADNDFAEMHRVAEIMVQGDDHSEFSRAAHYYAAMSLARQDKKEEAEAAYRDAIRYFRMETLKKPELVDGYMFRALCHKDMHEFDDAMKVLDYLDKLVPGYKPANLVRSAVYLEMGDKAKAAEAYQSAGVTESVLDDMINPILRGE